MQDPNANDLSAQEPLNRNELMECLGTAVLLVGTAMVLAFLLFASQAGA